MVDTHAASAVEPPRERRGPRPQVIGFAVALAAATAVLAPVVWRLANRASWATGARLVTWLGPDDRPLATDRYGWRCGDTGLDSLLDGDGLWTTCRKLPSMPAGALARIEPGAGRALVRWPFPPEHELARASGVARAPDGAIAFAYEAWRGLEHRVLLGIAGPRGWLVAPSVLGGGRYDKLIGLAFAEGGAVEAAVIQLPKESVPTAEWPRVTIVRLERSGRVSERALEAASDAECAAEYCKPIAALHGPAGWTLVRERYLDDGVTVAAPDGSVRIVQASTRIPELEIDLSVSGAVHGNIPKLTADPTVAIAPIERPPGAQMFSILGHHYRFDGARLTWTPHWQESYLVTQRVGTAWITTEHRTVGGERLSARAPDDELLVLRTGGAESVLARAHSYSCADLYDPALVPRREGGHHLVDNEGCTLAVDAGFERADPLGLFEHLARRGSIFLDRRERSHALLLIGLLGGLPLLLLVAAGVGWLRRSASLVPWLTAAATTYALVGAILLARLWPLLR